MKNIFAETKNKLQIKDVIEYYLATLFNRNNKCRCPFHDDKNASLSIKPSTNTFKCFGCGESGSVIDFVMKYKNVDKLEALKILNQDFNLGLQFNDKVKKESTKEYILRCEKDIDKTDYFRKRGLSNETIKKYRLGYDKAKKQVIIPYSSDLRYYQARSVTDKRFYKPLTSEVGQEPLYNETILNNYQGEEPIFIVESPICAMSLGQYYTNAIATCGGNGVNKLAGLIKKDKGKTKLSFILCFDNDEAGIKFNSEMSAFLKSEKIKFISYNIAGQYKDPNDCLQHNRDELLKNISKSKELFYKQHTRYGDLISAKEIMNMKFPKTKWYLNKLFTKGVNLLCGASKSGKSWFVQQLCLAVSSGEPMLNENTSKAVCWYMALKDEKELSQIRLKKMLQGKPVPEGFLISYDIYSMDKVDRDKPTLQEYMESILNKNRQIKVVIIDTFQKVRSFALVKESLHTITETFQPLSK